MATLYKAGAGWRIQFELNGKRPSVRIPKQSRRSAEKVQMHVENLVTSKASNVAVEPATATWLRDVGDDLHERLAKTGLVEPRDGSTVAGLVMAFYAANPKAKPATRVVWGHVERNLKEHFGETRQIRTITRADGEEFRQHLIDEGLAGTTVGKRLAFARQFFAHAVRFDWIEKNPFEGVSHKGGDPAKRQRYITEDETKLLIDAAPDCTWKTIIALARFGGLRCPSEVLSLRLADLDWERGAMTVTSPKGEGHGKGRRAVPMFARLRPYLETAWDMAAEGQANVIPENLYLPAANGPSGWVNMNLRTEFGRIVDRAGLDRWPRLFHALRASCESDLAREYPITTVCKWIGNTVAIAARHYVQVTDADFQKAASGAVRNPVQSMRETPGKPLKRDKKNPENTRVFDNPLRCTDVHVETIGLEPTTPALQKRCSPN